MKYRIIIVLSVAFVITMGLMAIRDFFDSSDERAALQIMNDQGHFDQINPKDCTTYLVSRYQGRVLVECEHKDIKSKWLVEIVKKTVDKVKH